MFDFLLSGKQKQARALLASRANKLAILDVSGRDRISTRRQMVEAVMAVPRAGRRWDYAEAFPVLTCDVSAGGVCVLHHEKLEGTFLLRLSDEVGSSFLGFAVQHASSLGYGYWRIGLEADEVVHPSKSQLRELDERIAVFEEYAAQQEASGSSE